MQLIAAARSGGLAVGSEMLMPKGFGENTWEAKYLAYITAAKVKLQDRGYVIDASVDAKRELWITSKDGTTTAILVKTSNTRLISFRAQSGGWQSLDDADEVLIVTVDSRQAPKRMEFHLFDANVIRLRLATYVRRRNQAAQPKLKHSQPVALAIDAPPPNTLMSNLPPLATPETLIGGVSV